MGGTFFNSVSRLIFVLRFWCSHKSDAQATICNSRSSLGPLVVNLCFKICSDGTLENTSVVCKFCKKELPYQRINPSLKYHLNAKHVAASTDVPHYVKVQAFLKHLKAGWL